MGHDKYPEKCAFWENFDRQNGDYLVTKLTCDCPPPILTILGNSDSATFYPQMELIDLILHLHNLLCNGAWLNAGSNENVPNSLEKHKFYNNNLFLWEYFYGSIQCLFWHKWLLLLLSVEWKFWLIPSTLRWISFGKKVVKVKFPRRSGFEFLFECWFWSLVLARSFELEVATTMFQNVSAVVMSINCSVN